MKRRIQHISFARVEQIVLGVLVVIAAGLAIRLYSTALPPGGRYVIGVSHAAPLITTDVDGAVSGPLMETFDLAARNLGVSLGWVALDTPADLVLADPATGIDLAPLVMTEPGERGRIYATEPYWGSHRVVFTKQLDATAPGVVPAPSSAGRVPLAESSQEFPVAFPGSGPGEVLRAVDLLNAVCEDRLDAAVVEEHAAHEFLQGLPRHCGTGRISMKPVNGAPTGWGIGARPGREHVARAFLTEIGRLASGGELAPVFVRHPEYERLLQRHLLATTPGEQLAPELTVSLLACLGLLGILTAKVILQRRQRALAQAREQAKAAFLSAMSHEIRTPLAGVLGMAELLANSPLDARQRSCLEQIRSAGGRLLAIVNDVLVLSKLEAGQMQFQIEPTPLRPMLQEVLTPLAVLAGDKGLEIIVDIRPEVPGDVALDRLKTGQILTNLVGNAVKFTDAGGVKVTVSLVGIPSIDRRLRFEIADTGCGIAPSDLGEIFTMYGRLRTVPAAEGTGLGLPIARLMVLHMGGYFGVTSTVGRGSQFWFEIPLEADIPVAHPPAPRGQRLRGISVVIGLNSDFLQQEIQLALEAEGALCRFSTAADPQPSGSEASLAESTVYLGEDPLLPGQRAGAIDLASGWRHPRRQSLVRLAPPGLHEHTAGSTDASGEWVCGRPLFAGDLVGLLQQAAQVPAPPKDLFPMADAKQTAARRVIPDRLDRSLRVLVAEDNPINQRILSAMLDRLGVHCRIAVDGNHVLRLLDERPFDLVLMDCRMPNRDGLETTVAIRRSGKTYAAIPVIGMSAEMEWIQHPLCSEAGMNGYLEKPYSLEKLAAVLDPFLRQTLHPPAA